jgi:hypothetical protein
MAELRAPDPTLTASDQLVVWLTEGPGLLSVAHRHRGCSEIREAIRPPVSSTEYARWFAVPCRACFPDAPPPGWVWENKGESPGTGTAVCVSDLSWQRRPCD